MTNAKLLSDPLRLLAPLCLAVAVSLLGDLALFAVLVTQLEVTGLSLGAVGIMLGVHRLVRIPGNPLAGMLLDRWGRRLPFLAGMCLAVLSTGCYGLVSGFWPFLVARIGWGLAWILIHVGGTTMVLDISTPSNRGRLLGFYNSGAWAGYIAGPLLGGVLTSKIGFRPTMLVYAGLALLALGVTAVALPETATRPAPASAASEAKRPHHPSSFPAEIRRESLAMVSGIRPLKGLLVVCLLFLVTQFAGDGVVLSTLSLRLQQLAAAPAGELPGRIQLGDLDVATAAGILLGLRSLLAAVCGPIAGHLSDSKLGRSAVISGSFLLGAAAFCLFGFGRTMGPLGVGLGLSAVSGGAALAVLPARAGDYAQPGRQGRIMGVYAAAGDIGSMLGPFAAFALVAAGRLGWIYLICIFAFLGGLWLARSERRTTEGTQRP